jgi:hypothetical protein
MWPRSDGGIVVGSAPSSGSTLVRVLFGRIDGVVSGGELNVIDRPELFDVDAATLHAGLRDWMAGRLARTFVGGTFGVFRRAPDFGWTADELAALAPSCGDWGELLGRFFAGARERARADRWVEKTPGNVFAFHRVLSAVPDTAFAHVVRDGRDVTASLMRRGHGPFRAVSRWMFSVLAGLRQESLPRARRIVYERLATDPLSTMQAACHELALPFDPAILVVESGRAASAHPSWLLSERGPISASSVGAHRDAEADRILAHLGAVRLSDEGRAFLAALPGGEEPGDPSGLDVMRRLGYLDGEPKVPKITAADRERSRREIADYLRRVAGRGGPVAALVPTRLD